MEAKNENLQVQNQGIGPWQSPFFWMVIAGPVLVIIASMVTLYLAIKNPETPVDNSFVSIKKDINQLDAQQASALPAMQGRNHAARLYNKPE